MPTIKDVAKKANVSVATVSRVLNSTGYVNVETKQLVLEAIKELDYTPSELARSLYKKQSNLIGVVIPHLTSYFYAELIEALEDAVIDRGYRLMIFNARNDQEREEKFLTIFSQYHLSGLIIATQLNSLEPYKKLKLPIMAIDHHVDDGIPSVSSDNVLGGQLAAQHFLDQGHPKVIHFRGASFLLTVKQRDQGFKETLRQKKITIIDEDVDFNTPDVALIESTLKKHPDAKGVFCDGDVIAMHVLKIASTLGLKVPADIEVIGFDDLRLNSLIQPSLSSIKQDIKTMALLTIDGLIERIHHPDKKLPPQQTLPVILVKRESTH
jgi:DNA-binding LacI/PurR family transcriptional regulator